MGDRAGSVGDHWDRRYAEIGSTAVSWYEQQPGPSLEMIDACGVNPSASVIDVGGGASLLVDALLTRGHTDVTVLDISGAALEEARRRVTPTAPVAWILGDVREWTPSRRWDVWHDRAVFHFLTESDHRRRYLRALDRALADDGCVVIGTFASNGPTHCSGLPVERYDARRLFDELTSAIALDLIATREHDHTTPSGATQPFTWIAARRTPPG